MSAKHTPTPWTLERFGCIRGGALVDYVGGKGQPQIVMVSGGDEQQANAELIVRAVNSHHELVRALRELRNNVEKDLHGYWTESTANMMQQADQAISKATGAE